MLLREHHHSGRVAKMVFRVVRLRYFADAMIKNQPAVPVIIGACCADLEPFQGDTGVANR